MKKCLICGAMADEKAETCPKCGEGTWATAKILPPSPRPVAVNKKSKKAGK